MKAFLMHQDEDFDLQRPLPANEADLLQDLELPTLLEAMAGGDRFLFDVAKQAVLSSLTDPEAIIYRQQVLADCLKQPAIVRELHQVAVEALQAERRSYFGMGISRYSSPDSILARSVSVLEVLLGSLKRLRAIADQHTDEFRSDGFTPLFAMFQKELGDEYFETVETHLKELKFRRGVLLSAQLGKGNKGIRHVLRRPRPQRWIERVTPIPINRSGYSFQIPDRDDNGFRALEALRGRGINLVANALAQSADHVLSFFVMLRTELAFYVGCLNLHERLAANGEPTCVPVPVPVASEAEDEPVLSAQDLYDPCLTLHLKGEQRAVGNALHADGKRLVLITGANQGGKSTMLRAIGVAQLMLQCGMFVAATSFRANPCAGLFTHYKREEDTTMESGKLDEELSRMAAIADQITPGAILLCNESFAATNEREGSEIARQVVGSLVEAGVKVFFVTHLFDLAQGFHQAGMDDALFLRAERQPDGRRTYRVVEGEPLPTSFGEDAYRRIFGSAASAPTGGLGRPIMTVAAPARREEHEETDEQGDRRGTPGPYP